MRIVIDLQGAQSGSRFRGIGRYSLDLALAIAKNRGPHEVIIALSDLFPDTISDLRAAFLGILPHSAIRVWTAVSPVASLYQTNTQRRAQAELIRETFLAALEPDVILIASLFEGFDEDVVTTIGQITSIPTAVILYDLIPLIRAATYLSDESSYKFYMDKVGQLKKADHLLSISSSAADEAVVHLAWDPARVTNISTAANQMFRPLNLSKQDETDLCTKYGITRKVVMYTGGIDHRKNIEGLITAFAGLGAQIFKSYQLAIVCSASENDREKLLKLANSVGLGTDSLILTGYVPDDDLVRLYNICDVFVFPSLHEGFGLPALEAMHCGKAVIASNTSSLPEVIGRADALFNPENIMDITAKLRHVLTDAAFRQNLERHGLDQAQKFSWDLTAQTAIAALLRLHNRTSKHSKIVPKQKLAFVSPLPPERTGIAVYNSELLPVLSEYYQIDVITPQTIISSDWINSNLSIRDVNWFEKNFSNYDRIIYHFGNSEFHLHMFKLLHEIPGIVVLHDFFLSGVLCHFWPNEWKKILFESHGFDGVEFLSKSGSDASAVWKYPANLSVLRESISMITHSLYSKRLAREYYGEFADSDWSIIPLLRSVQPRSPNAQQQAKVALGYPSDSILICSFGIVSVTKLNFELVDAFLTSSLATDTMCYLVLVGVPNDPSYEKKIIKRIRENGLGDRIHITGWAETDMFSSYLMAADIGVQLRTKSRGETSGTVLDCMAHGIPVIVNANGSMADLDRSAVCMLNDEFIQADLVSALERLATDSVERAHLGAQAQTVIKTKHDPKVCAKAYFDAIEESYKRPKAALQQLVDRLAKDTSDESEMIQLANALSISFPEKIKRSTIFVDVSVLAQSDNHNGIQRVVRSVLAGLFTQTNDDFEVLPVRRNSAGYYVVAVQVAQRVLSIDLEPNYGQRVTPGLGDIFLGLDLDQDCSPVACAEIDQMWRLGTKVFTVVYDLLPVRMPNYFPHGVQNVHTTWLERITMYDGAICISRAVADDLSDWTAKNVTCKTPFQIGWFHLGCDIESSITTQGVPNDALATLHKLGQAPTFLMVGTIEPRKGHRQVLAAFDLLWAQGLRLNLVIVGKGGWHTADLAKTLQEHPQSGKQLFWQNSISDQYLGQIYEASTCLIAASEGEGFGLPLIEAAQHRIPILARDLPVFKEVAGPYASYFSGQSPDNLALAIQRWLEDWMAGSCPKSDEMPRQTWDESSSQLFEVILGWLPADTANIEKMTQDN